jgi:murein L,D-transpeptidase YafK
VGDREGIFGFVMKRSSKRLPFGMSAGRIVALTLGVSAPLAFWAASSTLAGLSAKWAWVGSASKVASVSAAERSPMEPPAAGPVKARSLADMSSDNSPEGRLLEVYRLIGNGEMRDALSHAQKLSQDVPNFQLAQLAYGDLLLAQTAPISTMGNVPAPLAAKAPQRVDQLRLEAARRIAALQERPPVGAIPKQFIDLPPSTRHAMAVDASKSRLYLFENKGNGLQLVEDHYASIGKLGAEKNAQGDQRTPIGVYYITSRLEAAQLTDFYGVGALPLNYPNEYDKRLGRTGNGIWLHGVPSDSYARSPQSTDGCVALANSELKGIIEQVQPRTTPVVISRALEWVEPQAQDAERRSMRNLIEGWRVARSGGDMNRLMAFYSAKFASGGKDLSQWRQILERESSSARGRSFQVKDLAILAWHDRSDLMVVTFGELSEGERTGVIKRQYWTKEDGLWKIFFEGVIG